MRGARAMASEFDEESHPDPQAKRAALPGLPLANVIHADAGQRLRQSLKVVTAVISLARDAGVGHVFGPRHHHALRGSGCQP